jgi:eukaryotic-like serine/threonine-protein kinase
LLGEALRLNHLADSCCDPEQPSRAILTQRAELKRLLGDEEEANRLEKRAVHTSLQTSADHYLAAAESIAKGNVNEALPLLVAATDQDPQDFWAWFLEGVCHDHLAQGNEAIACYGTCIALAPDSPWAYLNRGLAHLRQRNYQRASADLDQAIGLRPELAEAYRNRALARQGLKQFDGAIEDLTRALDLGASPTQVYFLRAETRARAGDRDGADRDRAEGLRHEPKDEMGWLARGYARIGADLEGALADFDHALQCNPRSLTALQNKAHVLSKLGRNDAAAKTLDKAIKHAPDFVLARAGRGVLLARLGERDRAHQDADECLARDHKPLTLYQLAGIYALTSRTHAEDRQQAFRLLSAALQKGVGFELLETDRDLDPIRSCPEFQKLVDAARAIRTAALVENATTLKR